MVSKNIRSFFRGCPDGQARILSRCLSIDMNVLTDKTILAAWTLMTKISRREKISIESDTQKASIVRRTFTIIRKGTNIFLHYCRIFFTSPYRMQEAFSLIFLPRDSVLTECYKLNIFHPHNGFLKQQVYYIRQYYY